MTQPLKHTLILVAVLAVTGFVYAKLPTAYFCAYDDFVEVHRAAFEDTQDPKRVYTTTHFTSYKYRPLNRGLNLITYWAGSGSATEFRTRNVVCHLLNVVLIYVLAWLLFRSSFIGGTAALLFGLHPLANHAVVGAVMTNAAAHSLFLIAIVTFIISTRKRGAVSYLLMVVSLLCGWLSLLTYEAAIVTFPLLFLYLAIQFLAINRFSPATTQWRNDKQDVVPLRRGVRIFFKGRKWPVSRAYVIALTLGCFFFLGLYYLIHARYVPYSAKTAIPGLGIMLKSTVMYIAALLLPIDPVMANTWFGTPLPPDIVVGIGGNRMMQLLLLVGLVVVAGLVLLVIKFYRERLVSRSWPSQLFVAGCAVGAIAPLIVFTDKPSETYLYLTVGFAVLLFSSVLVQLLGPRASSRGRLVFAIIVGFLTVSYGTATWVRNSRVARCGEAAKQIVTSLQQDRFKNGTWFIWLAPARGEPGSHRYGMYGWRGVDTVGATAVEAAAQLANNNESLKARVLSPDELASLCSNSRYACFIVHADGAVDEVDRFSLQR